MRKSALIVRSLIICPVIAAAGCSGSCKVPFGGWCMGAYPDPERMTQPSQPNNSGAGPHDHGQWTPNLAK